MLMLSTIATRLDIVSADGGRILILQKVADAKSAFAPPDADEHGVRPAISVQAAQVKPKVVRWCAPLGRTNA